MNNRVLTTLEYDKIAARLAQEATSDAGRRRCARLRPMSDIEKIQAAQTETGDALGRTLRGSDPSFSGITDPAASLKRLEVGGALGIGELLALLHLLDVTAATQAYVRETDPADSDTIDTMCASLDALPELTAELRRCLTPPDEVNDAASPTLRDIRRKIAGMGDRIHTALNRMLQDTTTRTYLQDEVITLRDDCYCLPVRSEMKAHVPGIVHDTSASGATLFIEPAAVVNLGNELRTLHRAEEEEIEKILARLSDAAGEHSAEIATNYHWLVILDLVFAKARLARKQNAMPSVLNTEGHIHIRKGRHPLLDPDEVVPIDVWLGEDFHVLILTGPNTGGKTVTLKTVGLLTLMAQAGLFIPAGEGSEIAVFRQVYADIGDEQSIEQSLSTFSAHMTNIVYLLKKANRDSLVLLDELCAGTDPDEGAALAVAILERLRRGDVRTLATTHYSELKVYAMQTEGTTNACCEFDVSTLSPTYRLRIGLPGKSNAFAISEKLGLPEEVITDAAGRISAETERLEDVLAELTQQRHQMETDAAAAARSRAEAESQQAQMNQQQEALAAERARVLQEAHEEAAAILQEAKDAADESIRTMRKLSRTGADTAAMERERSAIREKVNVEREAAAVPRTRASNEAPPEELRVGDAVRIRSLGLTGTVHTLPDAKGNLYVQAGLLRYQVSTADLERLPEEAPRKPATVTGGGSIAAGKSRSVSPEIKLLGMTVDEALIALDKYLDDAYLAHLPSVRIVHGKGTGALRSAVQEHLRRLPTIAEYHLGEYGEGDAGVTIATFK